MLQLVNLEKKGLRFFILVVYNNVFDNYSRGELFKGGNYSREETIDYKEVLTAETIQRRKLFMGGNYMRQ